MIKILGNRVLVSKIEEEKKEGFEVVDIQDNFLYKGKVEQSNIENLSVGYKKNEIKVGDIVLFRKYSPDTEEVELEGRKMKIINVEDVIGIYEGN